MTLPIKLLPLVFLLSAPLIWAQDTQQPIDEWVPPDFAELESMGTSGKIKMKTVLEEPKAIKREDIDKLDFGDLGTLKNFQLHQVRKIPVEKDPPRGIIWPTPSFPALLRERSVLTNIKTGEFVYTFRKSYIVAQEEEAGGGTIIIFDKEKNKAFKTNAINVIDLTKDLELHSKPMVYKEYEAQEKFNADDEALVISHSISVHGELVQDEYLADLFGSVLPDDVPLESETFYAYGSRLEYKGYYRWQLPLEFGINLNYQEGQWLGQAEGLIWRSIFFGPIARYPIFKNEDFKLVFHMSFQKSLYYKATSLTDRFEFTYSTNALEAGINFDIPTQYGSLIIGGAMRRAKASVKSTTGDLRRDSVRGQMISGSLYLGWGFETTIL